MALSSAVGIHPLLLWSHAIIPTLPRTVSTPHPPCKQWLTAVEVGAGWGCSVIMVCPVLASMSSVVIVGVIVHVQSTLRAATHSGRDGCWVDVPVLDGVSDVAGLWGGGVLTLWLSRAGARVDVAIFEWLGSVTMLQVYRVLTLHVPHCMGLPNPSYCHLSSQ